MKFFKRLLYFSIGAVLGTFLVYLLFGGRNLQCSYFPNDRVLADLRKKELRLSESTICPDSCSADTNFFRAALLESDIDFDFPRDKNDSCRAYLLRFSWQGTPHQLVIRNGKHVARVESVEGKGAVYCRCE